MLRRNTIELAKEVTMFVIAVVFLVSALALSTLTTIEG